MEFSLSDDDKAFYYAVLEGSKVTIRNRFSEDLLYFKEPDMGENFLHLAARHQNIDTIKMLIELGFDPTQEDMNGSTPLAIAAGLGFANCLEPLCHEAIIDQQDKNGDTALHCAAYNGHGQCISELSRLGFNKEAVSLNGFTPLLSAVWFDQLKQLIILSKN